MGWERQHGMIQIQSDDLPEDQSTQSRLGRSQSRRGLIWSPVQSAALTWDNIHVEEFERLKSDHWFLIDHEQRRGFSIELTSDGALIIGQRGSEVILLKLPSTGPWLSARAGREELEERRGFFHIKNRSKRTEYYVGLPPSTVQVHPHEIRFKGDLCSRHAAGVMGQWALTLTVTSTRDDEEALTLALAVYGAEDHPKLNRTLLHIEGEPDEKIFGFGAQLSRLDLKGAVVPTLTQEPGIGRGVQPLTWMMERFFGAGGSEVQTSAPSALYFTDTLQVHALEDDEFALFDLSRPAMRLLEVWSASLRLRVFGGKDTPQGRLRALTSFTGRMPPLPSWLDRGAILGLQGGSQRVRELWERCLQAGVQISALWLQDWVGKRETSIGEQLWWDWALDEKHYPDWRELLEDVKGQGGCLLGYVNPYLVDMSELSPDRSTHSLFQIAKERGFLVGQPDQPNTPLLIQNTSFKAAIVDLTSEEAFSWLKQIIKDRMVSVGLSGWMADFGEALPFDAQLKEGDPQQVHNRFPVLWARLNREVVEELKDEAELLFFVRSGFTLSPRYTQLMWLGDQLTSWEREDGIFSAFVGLLSSGFSGMSLTHSDVGGYICTDLPRSRLRLPMMSYVRTPELLMRWAELNAFTAVLRTHEGNQPQRHHQVYDSEMCLQHFARMSQLYVALSPVRRTLMEQAKETGIPLNAHPWIYYPDDPVVLHLVDHFMLGADLMIVPALKPKQTHVKVYLPLGEWGHWWSHRRLQGEKWYNVPTPLGFPAAFYRVRTPCEEIARGLL